MDMSGNGYSDLNAAMSQPVAPQTSVQQPPKEGIVSPPPYSPQAPAYYPPPQPHQQQQTVVVQPPAPTPSVMVVQQQMAFHPKPPSHMTLAILSCFLWPSLCSFIAVIFSCLSDDSYGQGHVDKARERGRVSLWLSVTGIIFNIIGGIICLIIIFAVGASTAAHLDCHTDSFGLTTCT